MVTLLFLSLDNPSFLAGVRPVGSVGLVATCLCRRQNQADEIRRLVNDPELAGDDVDPVEVRVKPDDLDFRGIGQDLAERTVPIDVFVVRLQHDHGWMSLPDVL